MENIMMQSLGRCVNALLIVTMCLVSGCGPDGPFGPSKQDVFQAHREQQRRSVEAENQRLLYNANSFQEFQDIYWHGSGYWTWVDWQKKVNDRQRIWYLMEHPELDTVTRSYIEAGSVRIGMTADQCRAGWGVPIKVHRTSTVGGVYEMWTYSFWLSGGGGFQKRGTLHFKDGILTIIQN